MHVHSKARIINSHKIAQSQITKRVSEEGRKMRHEIGRSLGNKAHFSTWWTTPKRFKRALSRLTRHRLKNEVREKLKDEVD
jgi:hypothetical protein